MQSACSRNQGGGYFRVWRGGDRRFYSAKWPPEGFWEKLYAGRIAPLASCAIGLECSTQFVLDFQAHSTLE